MKLVEIDVLEVYYKTDKRKVTLVQGDISSLEALDSADYLICSAFPNDYAPVSGTIIGSLASMGVNLREMAAHKEVSYLPEIPCWISSEIENQKFKRIACYEPEKGKELDSVNYLLSAIATLEQNKEKEVSVIIPMLCCGCGNVNKVDMLTEIFYAAVHWGAMQFPFKNIKILLYGEQMVKTMKDVFATLKYNYLHIESLQLGKIYSKLSIKNLSAIVGDDPYLTPRQIYAVRLYTGSYYSTINRILRENNHKSDEYIRHRPLFEALDTALRNLPLRTGTVYRGEGNMDDKRKKENQPGNHVLNSAYTSTAYVKGVFYNGAKYKFDIESLTGSMLEQYSVIPSEKEVLLERDMKYLVLTNVGDEYKCLITANEDQQTLRR